MAKEEQIINLKQLVMDREQEIIELKEELDHVKSWTRKDLNLKKALIDLLVKELNEKD